MTLLMIPTAAVREKTTAISDSHIAKKTKAGIVSIKMMREISWSKFFGTIRSLTRSMPEMNRAISVQNPSSTSSTSLRILGKITKGSLGYKRYSSLSCTYRESSKLASASNKQ